MRILKHLILVFLMGLFAFEAKSNLTQKNKIESLELTSPNQGVTKMLVKYQGKMLESPELLIKDKMVQIAVPNSYVWPKIERRATVNDQNDTTVMAYQFEKDIVRVRAMLPFSLSGMEDRVNVVLRDGYIELNFPVPSAKAQVVTKTQPSEVKKSPTARPAPQNELAPVVEGEVGSMDSAQYDESFLANLIKENDFNESPAQESETVQDIVQLKSSSIEKNVPGFSMTNLIVKFVAFLGLVLVLFYGVVTLMKKGVLKKGGLGFLNSTKTVEVLSTTHIAPKKSLLLIRAHNQVFLVGSSEKGLDMISEIRDVTGLMKDGEKSIAGSNFDSTLGQTNTYTKDFKLKEDIMVSSAETSNSNNLGEFLEQAPVKDSVKLSDQIKSKVKNLKSLQ
jgi:flagellar biogenesis protein FliO